MKEDLTAKEVLKQASRVIDDTRAVPLGNRRRTGGINRSTPIWSLGTIIASGGFSRACDSWVGRAGGSLVPTPRRLATGLAARPVIKVLPLACAPPRNYFATAKFSVCFQNRRTKGNRNAAKARPVGRKSRAGAHV